MASLLPANYGEQGSQVHSIAKRPGNSEQKADNKVTPRRNSAASKKAQLSQSQLKAYNTAV